eukprot:NODE_6453_length_358_cov_10.585761_g5730_i0.p1 GENE.NODE_6453_length_358_cov_10.585761_g5730_i0~~NODE_6453_length_358_cov_10.585761_g5730_i0.p1  ORF type:complete len:118 (-),score=33.41 NODE_6453_length_358_cov_10.585761_g5730_i0:5-316(-)
MTTTKGNSVVPEYRQGAKKSKHTISIYIGRLKGHRIMDRVSHWMVQRNNIEVTICRLLLIPGGGRLAWVTLHTANMNEDGGGGHNTHTHTHTTPNVGFPCTLR